MFSFLLFFIWILIYLLLVFCPFVFEIGTFLSLSMLPMSQYFGKYPLYVPFAVPAFAVATNTTPLPFYVTILLFLKSLSFTLSCSLYTESEFLYTYIFIFKALCISVKMSHFFLCLMCCSVYINGLSNATQLISF